MSGELTPAQQRMVEQEAKECPAEEGGYDGMFGVGCDLPRGHPGPHRHEWENLEAGVAASVEPATDDPEGRVQMYNLAGEYPDLPSRLLAWPDYCVQVERADRAEEALAAASVEPEGREAAIKLDDELRFLLDDLPGRVEILRQLAAKLEQTHQSLNAAWEAAPEPDRGETEPPDVLEVEDVCLAAAALPVEQGGATVDDLISVCCGESVHLVCENCGRPAPYTGPLAEQEALNDAGARIALMPRDPLREFAWFVARLGEDDMAAVEARRAIKLDTLIDSARAALAAATRPTEGER